MSTLPALSRLRLCLRWGLKSLRRLSTRWQALRRRAINWRYSWDARRSLVWQWKSQINFFLCASRRLLNLLEKKSNSKIDLIFSTAALTNQPKEIPKRRVQCQWVIIESKSEKILRCDDNYCFALQQGAHASLQCNWPHLTSSHLFFIHFIFSRAVLGAA